MPNRDSKLSTPDSANLRHGFTYEKQLAAAECARADVWDERRVWAGQRQARMHQEPHRLVFLDGTYINTKMTRLRGRGRKGQRVAHERTLWPLEDANLYRRAAVQRAECTVDHRWSDHR